MLKSTDARHARPTCGLGTGPLLAGSEPRQRGAPQLAAGRRGDADAARARARAPESGRPSTSALLARVPGAVPALDSAARADAARGRCEPLLAGDDVRARAPGVGHH